MSRQDLLQKMRQNATNQAFQNRGKQEKLQWLKENKTVDRLIKDIMSLMDFKQQGINDSTNIERLAEIYIRMHTWQTSDSCQTNKNDSSEGNYPVKTREIQSQQNSC